MNDTYLKGKTVHINKNQYYSFAFNLNKQYLDVLGILLV